MSRAKLMGGERTLYLTPSRLARTQLIAQSEGFEAGVAAAKRMLTERAGKHVHPENPFRLRLLQEHGLIEGEVSA